MWLGGRAGLRVSTCAKEEAPGLSYQFAHMWAEEEGRTVGLESCQQADIKNGVRLFITAKLCCGNNT